MSEDFQHSIRVERDHDGQQRPDPDDDGWPEDDKEEGL